MEVWRDVTVSKKTPTPRATAGRMYVVAIGVDRYHKWSRLANAARDARGALAAFQRIGFEPFRALYDEDATHAALKELTDDLGALGSNDSLVLFFAGHGYTATRAFDDDSVTKVGYLLPVDAERASGKTTGWLPLRAWLAEISLLPVRHILIVLDACHSGIALDPVIKWRGEAPRLPYPLERLRERRSRRVITSAQEDQVAMDSGPVDGHSLFTGCLLEALDGGIASGIVTGTELGAYIQRRVMTFPGSRQTPDFGSLDHDNRGELILPLAAAPVAAAPPPVRPTRVPPASIASSMAGGSGYGPKRRPAAGGSQPSTRTRGAKRKPRRIAGDARRKLSSTPARDAATAPPPTAAFLAALDRHDAERRRGAAVVSMLVGGPPETSSAWAGWAARRGYLVLMTEAKTPDAAIAELLAQVPWLRCAAAARKRLASVAGIAEAAVDAMLDARGVEERRAWIEEVAASDVQARCAGWLLATLREREASVPDTSLAPVRAGALLAAVCDFAAPIAVLVHHAKPTAAWLGCAVSVAAALAAQLPRHAVAVAAPKRIVAPVLAAGRSSAFSMARQGLITVDTVKRSTKSRARSHAEQMLYDALARDRRTAGQFELNVQVPIHEATRTLEVDLVARTALLAVEIDGWFHFREPDGYRRDRIKDVWLQRAGFFVMRFLAEDVEDRLAYVVDEIAVGLASRRANGLFPED